MKDLRFVHVSILVAALFVGACGSESDSGTPPAEPLELTEAQAAFDIGSAKYYEAIEYGPYDENLFDIYIPESQEPTPLLLYIHGGGFTGGSRDTSSSEGEVMQYLELEPGPLIGEAMKLLYEHRIEHGPYSPEEAYALLDEWRAGGTSVGEP